MIDSLKKKYDMSWHNKWGHEFTVYIWWATLYTVRYYDNVICPTTSIGGTFSRNSEFLGNWLNIQDTEFVKYLDSLFRLHYYYYY